MQVAEIGDVWPEGLGLPRFVEFALRQVPVERHLHPLGDVVPLQVGRRERLEALNEVLRRGEGEHLAVVVDVQVGTGEAQRLPSEPLGVLEQLRGPRSLGFLGLLGADAADQVGEEVVVVAGGFEGLLDGLPGQQVLHQAVLFLPRAVQAGDALGGAETAMSSSSLASSFSATVVSSLAPSVWEVRTSAANCGWYSWP